MPETFYVAAISEAKAREGAHSPEYRFRTADDAEVAINSCRNRRKLRVYEITARVSVLGVKQAKRSRKG